jgi:hypothetical protein
MTSRPIQTPEIVRPIEPGWMDVLLASLKSDGRASANWQPTSQMALIASMIETSLDDTREHLV